MPWSPASPPASARKPPWTTTAPTCGCSSSRSSVTSRWTRSLARTSSASWPTKLAEGKSPKSVLNWLRLLHGIFEHAIKREWVQANPCKLVDKPHVEPDTDIRFLTQPEVEALLRKVPDDVLGPTERVLYLAATMTGMRQGELRAALARYRLDGRSGKGAAQLRPGRVRDAEVQALEPLRAAR